MCQTAIGQSFEFQSRFTSYIESDGLSSNEAHFLFEDDRKFLWVCTDEGMSRFDGKNFRRFGVEEGLPDAFVIKLKKLTSGRIIGWTLNGGIFWLNGDEIIPIETNIPIFKENYWGVIIEDIIQAKDGTLYISTSQQNGYFEIDPDGKVTHHEKPTGSHLHYCFTRIENDYFYYATKIFGNTELVSYKIGKDIGPLPNEFKNKRKHKLKPIRYKDNIILFANNYLLSFDGHKVKTQKTNIDPWNISIVDDKIWLCSSDRGVIAFDPRTLKPLGETLLPDKFVTCILKQQDGEIWATTLKSGLIRIDNLEMTELKFEKSEDVLYDNIESNNQNQICFATTSTRYSEGNLYCIDVNNDSKLNRIPGSITLFRKLTYRESTERFYYSDYHKNNLLLKNFKLDASFNPELYETKASSFYWALENIDKGKGESGSLRLMTENNDTFYFAKTDYITIMADGKRTELTQDHPKLKRDIRSIHKKGKTLHVGTKNKGLLYLQDNQVFQLSKKDGLLSNHITAISSFSEDTVILATNLGVNRIIRNEQGIFEPRGQLGKSSGLDETDILDIAITKDKLWFLTNNHLINIPPSSFDVSVNESQNINISEIRVNGIPEADSSKTSLYYNQNQISFHIEKIDFGPSKNDEILIQLVGQDKDWKKAQSGNIQYSNLSPGSYSFRAAVNKEQILNNTYKEFKFNIKNPFYKTFWFLTLIGLILSSCIYILNKRKNKLRQQKIKIIEQTNSLKMKALMTQINPHFTFNVINSIQSMILEKDQYQAAEKLADFSDLIRKVLEVADSSFITLKEDLTILSNYIEFEKIRLDNKFNYSLEVDQSILFAQVPPLIIQPLVENAIWHGLNKRKDNKGLVSIVITDVDNQLHFTISDNGGPIIESSTTKRHDNQSKGIELVRQRIRLANEQSTCTDRFTMDRNEDGMSISFYLHQKILKNET